MEQPNVVIHRRHQHVLLEKIHILVCLAVGPELVLVVAEPVCFVLEEVQYKDKVLVVLRRRALLVRHHQSFLIAIVAWVQARGIPLVLGLVR